MLAAGLLAALALAAAQYFSPVSRLIWKNQDVRLAVLGERAAVLMVYHSGQGKVSAFPFQAFRPKKGVSLEQRAADLADLAGNAGDVFYISVSSAPNLDALWGTLNKWRAEPALFLRGARWAWAAGAAGISDVSSFGLFALFSEFSRLDASDFFLAETAKAFVQEPEAEEEAGPARIEVFNASGRKDLAALAAKRLRALGFDVITAASYHKAERHTRILGFSRDTAAALRLRSALGLEELEIRVRPSQKSVAGAAVILGADFDDSVLSR